MKTSYREILIQSYSQFFDELELRDKQKEYLKLRWLDQVLWLELKSSRIAAIYRKLRVGIITFSTIVPILLSFNIKDGTFEPIIKTVALVLSGLVALGTSLEDFFQYGEVYRSNRKALSSLKKEGWLFLQSLGVYSGKNDSEAFDIFANKVETLISEFEESDVELFGKTKSRNSSSNV